MPASDEFRAALQAIVVPELRAIQAELRGMRDDLAELRALSRAWRRALMAEVERLTLRLEALGGELRRPASCARSSPRCRRGRGPRRPGAPPG